MTEAEIKVLDTLGQAANLFANLPEEHPSDRAEFVLAIHMAQNIVLARVGLRALEAK